MLSAYWVLYILVCAFVLEYWARGETVNSYLICVWMVLVYFYGCFVRIKLSDGELFSLQIFCSRVLMNIGVLLV